MNTCQIKIISWLLVGLILGPGLSLGCARKSEATTQSETQPVGRAVAPGVLEIGRLRHVDLKESSGIVASRQHSGVLWTHSDGSGKGYPMLHAVSRDGSSLATFTVSGTSMVDWEDIAIDSDQHLYLGDIGNNKVRRNELRVYQLEEPDPKGGSKVVKVKRTWRLRFSESPFDAEGLFIWKEYGYVVSKVRNDARAQIFRFPLSTTNAPVVLERIATTRIESPVTAADISADGRLLALMAKSGAFLYDIAGDVSAAGVRVPYRTRFRGPKVEGCCFVSDGLLATAESREIFLFTDKSYRGE